MTLLSKQQFTSYLNLLENSLKHQKDNLFDADRNILSTTERCPTENAYMVLELLSAYPEVFEKVCTQ